MNPTVSLRIANWDSIRAQARVRTMQYLFPHINLKKMIAQVVPHAANERSSDNFTETAFGTSARAVVKILQTHNEDRVN